MKRHSFRTYIFVFALFCAAINLSTSNYSFAQNVNEIAKGITPESGVIVSSWNGMSDKAVLILQETHISRVGQAEIALMLTRLYTRYHVRAIAVEGAFLREGAIDAKWFHKLRDRYAREEAALQLLRKGEIGAAEFIALAIPLVKIYGVEKQEEYEFDMSPLAESAPVVYLFAIAEKLFPRNEAKIIHANRLSQKLERAKDEEKSEIIKELMDYVINANQWTKTRYKELTVQDKVVSTEELCRKLEEIKTKAKEINADVEEYEEHLDKLIKFYKIASKRTVTMIDSALRLFEKNDGIDVIPVIMGAAHTAKACTTLEKENISYSVISPNSFSTSQTIGDLPMDAFERKRSKHSVDTIDLIGAYLDGRWKPRPVIGQIWLRSESELYYVCNCLAKSVASGERPPFESLENNFANLSYIIVDPASFEVIGDELLFKVTAKTNDPKRSPILWAKVAMLRSEDEQKSLEERLREVLEELREMGVETREKEGRLFNIGFEFRSDLNSNRIQTGLRREFQKAGFLLSPDAVISTEKADSAWLISDKHEIFRILKTDDTLTVSAVLRISKTSRNVIATFSEKPEVIRHVYISG